MFRGIFLFLILFCTILPGTVYPLDPIRYTDSIERIVRQTTDKKRQIELLLTATKKLRLTDPDQALELASRAFSIESSADYPELRLQAMLDMGSIMAFKSKFTSGLKMALQSKELAIKLDNKKALAESFMIVGTIMDYQGNYINSYESQFEALRLFESIGDQEGIMKAQNGIGSICYSQGDYKKSLIYYSKALAIARNLHDTMQVARELSNLGILLIDQGQITKAIEYYNEAISIHSHLGLKTRLAVNYLSLGVAFFKLKEYDSAFSNYQKSIVLLSEFKSWHSLATVYLHLSEYYLSMKDKKNELKYIRLAYTEGKKYKLKKVVFQAAGVLNKYYLSHGNIDSAYKYSLIQNAEKDSIEFEKSAGKLALLEMEYDYDKKLRDDKLQQQWKDFFIIIFTIVVVAGLIISFLFLSRQIIKVKNIRLEKKQLSDELEFKNKELTINVINLLKKNEFLVEHTDRLIEIQQKAKEEDIKTDILNLITGLQRGSGEHIWDEFEFRFKQVHSGFYDRLLSKFPDLSSNELKLCALLKLNLSTKEICELTGQRAASLDVARSRLRKKLGLTSSQTNLVTFLSQI